MSTKANCYYLYTNGLAHDTSTLLSKLGSRAQNVFMRLYNLIK